MKVVFMESLNEIEEHSQAVECKAVHLLPYEHQVGGHQCVFTYNEATICKPLQERELEFYTSLPEMLRPFVPVYKGVVDVHFVKDDQGKLHFLAIPSSCQCTTECNVEAYRSGDEVRKRSLWLQISNHKGLKCENSIPRMDEMQERLVSIINNKNRDRGIKFLLLGNVSANLKRPCVLDLKMGTRQYGDHEPDEKIRKRNRISASSTSQKLGVRLCGMQVFNCKSETFVFVDKYVGRGLDEIGFKNSMHSFIHNGHELLTGLIDPLLNKLKALRQVVESADCYRFYACSLLLIYDGMPYQQEMAESVDIRIIDFAKVSKKDDIQNNHKGPDRGLLLGLETLICILQDFQKC